MNTEYSMSIDIEYLHKQLKSIRKFEIRVFWQKLPK